MTRFVLASASPARLQVLRSAGVTPVVRVSDVDEDAVAAALPAGTAPADVVVALASAKAEAVAAALIAEDADVIADCVVVGCDSMLLLDGELQGKPLTAEVARKRWAVMAGRAAELLTGHCVLRLREGRIVALAHDCCGTMVEFGTPDPDELDAYIATGEPLRVAGAFTLDARGGWFVEGLRGDPSSVIGIGLPLLRRLLRDVGVSVAQLWVGGTQLGSDPAS
ncbi:Maf family nucleotide pyrophosphatase [Nocardia sp. NPDC004068]|uniref:Maf family nucleotide pyrophosphatase n=1 Tax=Nocardia sp. NPDC004068 TaxID=3364303 RepID=UPI00367AB61F